MSDDVERIKGLVHQIFETKIWEKAIALININPAATWYFVDHGPHGISIHENTVDVQEGVSLSLREYNYVDNPKGKRIVIELREKNGRFHAETVVFEAKLVTMAIPEAYYRTFTIEQGEFIIVEKYIQGDWVKYLDQVWKEKFEKPKPALVPTAPTAEELDAKKVSHYFSS